MGEPPLISYKWRFLIYLILLGIILIALIVLFYPRKAVTGQSEAFYGHSDMFLEPISPHYVPYVETFGDIIDDLADCESSNNPEVINWNDNGSPSFGLLQFKKTTFQHFCVEKYKLVNDIMDEDIQRQCCDLMLKDNLHSHWTCWFKI